MAKILLVEDDNNLRSIYEMRLQAEGHDIVTASDGEEALALAVKEKPELIVSDVMMPKISGFDMLDILRSTPETKNTKVIMMTALSQAEDQARAESLGADRYLVKSQVTLEDVVKAVEDVLKGGQATTNAEQIPGLGIVAATAPVAIAMTADPYATPQAPVAPTIEPIASQQPVVTLPLAVAQPVIETTAPEVAPMPFTQASTSIVEPVAPTSTFSASQAEDFVIPLAPAPMAVFSPSAQPVVAIEEPVATTTQADPIIAQTAVAEVAMDSNLSGLPAAISSQIEGLATPVSAPVELSLPVDQVIYQEPAQPAESSVFTQDNLVPVMSYETLPTDPVAPLPDPNQTLPPQPDIHPHDVSL
jgi:CheY-like chemotaxis protein